MKLSDKTALIMVDMQNGFCHEDGFMNKIGLDWTTSRDAIGPVKRLIDAAHSSGMPVFYTRYTLNQDYSDAGLMREVFPQIMDARGMIRDTWDADIVDELAPGGRRPDRSTRRGTPPSTTPTSKSSCERSGSTP